MLTIQKVETMLAHLLKCWYEKDISSVGEDVELPKSSHTAGKSEKMAQLLCKPHGKVFKS